MLGYAPIRTLIAGLAAAALVAGMPVASQAAGGSKLLPKSSLWSQVKFDATPAEIKAICAEIIKREQTSRIAMLDASQLYLHGMMMGVQCAKVDYFRAWQLAHQAKDAFTEKATITFMTGRAEGGNEKAARALEKIAKTLKAEAKN